MKRIQVGICEDDAAQLHYLQQESRRFFAEKGYEAAIEVFESAEQLLFHYPSGMPFQCLLLDIGLKKMDGMELARKIRTEDRELSIIFITGEREHVFEGYKVGAARYLLKPYKTEDLEEALSSVIQLETERPEESYIGFQCQGEYVKLRRRDILLAEVRGHYLYVRTKKEEYSYKGSMKQLQNEWTDTCFVLANRSVLVNLENVERITRTECFLCDGSIVSVSRGCYQRLNQSFVEWFV